MELEFSVAKSKADLERCFPVLRELRPHLTVETFWPIYEEAHQNDGYEILFATKGDAIVALMGYRVLSDFVRGRHLYIDDLVTSEKFRSCGAGALLLKQAERIAAELGCGSLRLCTGIENHRGVQFYERNGWTRRSFAYVKKRV